MVRRTFIRLALPAAGIVGGGLVGYKLYRGNKGLTDLPQNIQALHLGEAIPDESPEDTLAFTWSDLDFFAEDEKTVLFTVPAATLSLRRKQDGGTPRCIASLNAVVVSTGWTATATKFRIQLVNDHNNIVFDWPLEDVMFSCVKAGERFEIGELTSAAPELIESTKYANWYHFGGDWNECKEEVA